MWLSVDRKYGQWAGLDLPVHRDWLFWVACLVAIAVGVFALHKGYHWESLAAIVWVPGVGFWVGTARNVVRGLRE